MTNISAFKITPTVLAAIRHAHAVSQIDFGFLMAMCAQESAFNPLAKPGINPKTGKRYSSAVGLYQFLDATWAGLVQKYGLKYRIGINDRENPMANAIMGALFAKENADYLTKKGHKVGRTELYMGHFLGAGGANVFLSALAKNPSAKAANITESAAKANPSIYYKNGVAKTLAEVYAFFQAKIEPNATAFAAAYKAA
jgi:hypothetical protein